MRLTIIYFSYVNLFVYSKGFSNMVFGTFRSSECILKSLGVSKLRNKFNTIEHHVTNNNNLLIFTDEH
jgi:hypothetical protein